ncbi:DNA topoisomerase VI subunit B [Candidatus Woesearchaeota archaeon]|nr:DNA topoisomerase VI subunit B [Candidatus Woesearchaeota archaeon]MBT5740280.1 DNA topoisomerase VI subunit B [Candidatus Woesearchaeota archaeon]
MVQKSAEELAKKHREISIAEFFEKNRHLLGFDNPRRALLTAIKEGVDNALDACEEARILPEINVEIIQLSDTKFRVIMEDNGPGIIRKQIPNIFARLLYGSKFHKLAATRGQQGIGISAAVLYGQLTTGKPATIVSKTGKGKEAHKVKLKIDTQKNKAQIISDEIVEWDEKDHGTRIEIDMEGGYQKGRKSVDEYIKETAVVNPHITIIYTNPEANQTIFPRATEELPPEPKEIKPHPYGVELGILMKMLQQTDSRTLQSFLQTEFVRVGAGTAKDICEAARLLTKTKPSKFTREMAEQLYGGIQVTKIMAPPTDCISPIGAENLEKGLRKEINAEFYCSTTRPAAVYRGNPFVVEAALAYGGEQLADKTVRVMRFANRVPLLYQQGSCAITKAIQLTTWKNYGLQQSRSTLPVGPCTVVVHMTSTWVPFTSEEKSGLAHYEDIMKEIKLALQDCGRQLASFVKKKKRVKDEFKKRDYIKKFIPSLAGALKTLLNFPDSEEERIINNLYTILEQERGEVKEIKFDPTKNTEYDSDLASFGKEEKQEDE